MLAKFALTSVAGGVASYVDDVFSAYAYKGNGGTQTITNGIELYKALASSGDVVYSTPGTFSWTCPAGVTSVCVAALGAGAGGQYYNGTFSTAGGGGGGLGWKNNIAVTPGNSYTVVVGGSNPNAAGGDTYFIDTTTVRGRGGAAPTSGSGNAGGSFVGDGGKTGGNGGASFQSSNAGGGGGGGAATLTNNGGNGQAWSSGSGFGGTGGQGITNLYGTTVSTTGGSANAAPGVNGTAGGNYGGGGGGHASNGSSGWSPGTGGGGLLRIMWGAGRAFPSTNISTSQIADPAVGGLVWLKCRDTASTSHELIDTVRGSNKWLASDTAAAEATAANIITAFNTNGFSLGVGDNAQAYATKGISWTFKKAAKFFDVVTYTGDGTANRAIAHSLGVAPGMIIVKTTSAAQGWSVYHRSLGTGKYLSLHTTDSTTTDANAFPAANSLTFTPTTGAAFSLNEVGVTYVAYLFAHDTSSDGIVQCGTFTGSASQFVTLGWEPQFLMVKRTNTTSSWWISDQSRSLNDNLGNGGNNTLQADSNAVESSPMGATGLIPKATGFQANISADTYVYLAIRRPNKPPTTGTQVFSPQAQSTSATSMVLGSSSGWPTDMLISKRRNTSESPIAFSRLQSMDYVFTGSTAPAGSFAYGWDNSAGGVTAPWDTDTSTVSWSFKRAPGVFDVVCWSGGAGSTNQRIAHSLGVAPELVITKARSAAQSWYTYVALLGRDKYLELNTTVAAITVTDVWGTADPTATDFGMNTSAGAFNYAAKNIVSYLFATKAGISKVGSYTGNGSSQTINCGFTTGARFVMIKQSNGTGNWFVWDTTRGIVAAADPRLILNSTAVEVTTEDAIDPDSSGFIVNNVTGGGGSFINATGDTYIYLAIA